MNGPTYVPLRVGDWRVDPNSDQISRNGEAVRVEAQTLRLLLYLAERPGEVVSIEELLPNVSSASPLLASDSTVGPGDRVGWNGLLETTPNTTYRRDPFSDEGIV